MTPTLFYYTAHPGDLMRARLLPGAAVLIVASAFWDSARARFRVIRPPAGHLGTLAIDSGGFTAARRWGRYPWTAAQYCDWIAAETRDIPLAWCAVMDYACEREVDRTALATNRARIKATIRNEQQLRELAPHLPWLGVLQGNTLAERSWDIRLRQRLGLLRSHMGIGSICRRPPAEAAQLIRWYADQLPATRFHAFGLDVRALDRRPSVGAALAGWDSYAWTWPRGAKGVDRPATLVRQPTESYSQFLGRVAADYQAHTITPRLQRAVQLALKDAA